jgi:hypothetical protein
MVHPPDRELPGRLRRAAAVLRDVETGALIKIAANRIEVLLRARTGEVPVMPVEKHMSMMDKLKERLRRETMRADTAERAIRSANGERDYWRIRARQAGDQAA